VESGHIRNRALGSAFVAGILIAEILWIAAIAYGAVRLFG
jgi:hypothetical protein